MIKTPKTKQKYHVKKGFVIDFYLIPLKNRNCLKQIQKIKNLTKINYKLVKKHKTNNYNHYSLKRQKA